MTRNLLSSLFAVLLSLSAVAQTAETFTLEKAKTHALEHHVDIRNAVQDVEIAKQQMVETRGMGLPQVDITGKFNHFLNIPVQVVDASLFNPFASPGEVMEFRMGQEFSSSGSLTVNQLLFNGSYIVGLQVSKFYKQFQETAAEVTKEEVVFNVVLAYQMTSIAKGNKAFADTMVSLTEQMIEKQQHFLDLGMILQEDMDQLNYSLLSAKNAAVAANVQYQNSLNMVKLAMGYPMDQEITITETADELLTKETISSGSIENNLQLQMLSEKTELSRHNMRNNKMANLPSLYAFFDQTYNAYRNEFNFFANEKWYPQTVWGLQLNVPVFSGLQRHAKIKQSKIAWLKDQNSMEQLEEALKFQEASAKNNLTGAKAKYELQKENVALAQSLYDNTITKEKIGKGNSITVTQKQNQLMIAQSQYLGSLVDLFQAQLELDKLYNKLLSNQ